ncbi:apolipoprotein B-100 [Trichonephila clavipes]|nr:apolipoprotein B-100 [Trichonephila clavipes]
MFNLKPYPHSEELGTAIKDDYDTNVDSEKELSLEQNMNPSQKWLHKIIPPSMWETDTKAWVQLRIDWKGTKVYTLASTRQTLISIKDPQTTIDFIGNSFKMMGREQTSINVTKTEISSGKLLGFANFTINEWNVEDDTSVKEITSYNLTISQKSWAFQWESIRSRDKIIMHVMKLKTSAMIPPNEMGDYVGWWSKEVSQDFRIEEKQLKLVIDVDMPKAVENGKELEKYPNLKREDLGDLSARIMTASMRFYYPIVARKESVTFVAALIALNPASTDRLANLLFTVKVESSKFASSSTGALSTYLFPSSHKKRPSSPGSPSNSKCSVSQNFLIVLSSSKTKQQ